MEIRPNRSEELFLSLGYNRFYELFDEIMADDFWEKEDWYRFSKVSNVFAVYSELLTYEPFKYVLEALKDAAPSYMDSPELSTDFLHWYRCVLIYGLY